jgi:hypothetical protein
MYRHKHALFYCKDGNFVQGQHNKKMDHEDYSLTDGASYYADNSQYEAVLRATDKWVEFKQPVTSYSSFMMPPALTCTLLDYNLQ